LYLVAATDRDLESAEKRFLQRVGKIVVREIDFERITKFCEHLDEGEELPDGFYRCG
jgi:hypothetical protein